jgi:tetratricopeptide (TPR) repeat protein
MSQPAIFISCVSPEFSHTRSRIADVLTRLGYTPLFQEVFDTEPGDLRQVLRYKIDACEGLIQIVGDAYGAEPPTVDATYGRVSYTQFEFLYARSKKKTWLIFAGDACTRDTPLEHLDLPNDPAHPDPTGYQAERRALQLAYRDKRRNDGHLYYDATSDTDLELKVERLRDELAKLRQAFNLWQNKVLRAFAVVFVLLVLIGGSVWWLGSSQHRDLQGLSEEARHITKAKIRAQLLESIERTRKEALAQADKAPGWQDRERLRQAAEKAYAGNISQIDELAASFAEVEGTERSTQVFDEMTRILKHEGVDGALAYVATRRSGIVEKVKARAAAAREKNRAELLPLLKSAQLQADRNRPEEAEHLFTEVLELEPAWPEARDAFAWLLIQQGEVSEPVQGNAKLREAVQICQGTLALNPGDKSPSDWAAAQNDLGLALYEQGRRGEGAQSNELLAQAVAAFRSALEVYTREQLPQQWATTQDNLGIAFTEQAVQTAGPKATELLAQAVDAHRSALEVRTREQSPQDWARSQGNLAIALEEQALRTAGPKATELLAQAVAAYRSMLEVLTREQLPQQWAATQDNLGIALAEQAVRTAGPKATELLAQAVDAHRSALEVRTREQLPQDWARSQGNLGAALGKLSAQSEGTKAKELLTQAVAAFRSALEVQTREQLPQDWAATQYNLAYALGGLAFYLVLSHQFADAQAGCEQALALADEIGDGIQKTYRDDLIFIQQNLAHALLFQGHFDEALAIYRQNWDKPLRGKTFAELTLEDFAAFDKAGLTHPDLPRMKRVLGDLPFKAPGP